MQKYVLLNLILVTASTAVSFAFKGAGSQLSLDGIYGASTVTGGLDVTCRKRVPGDPQANCSWTETRNDVDDENFSSTSGIAINSHSITQDNTEYTGSQTTGIGVE